MENIKKSVFKIVTASGTGSGFVVGGYDLIITNYHVIKGDKVVAVEDYKKDRQVAHVVMVNPEVDLAFLHIDGFKNTTNDISLQDDIVVANAQKVYINGYPFGMPYTITEGIVSATNQPMGNRQYIQTDAAINKGNSGGPLVDLEGKVIGISCMPAEFADGVSFAIPVDTAKQIVDQIRKNGKVTR